jgi:TonB family protein
MTIGAPVEPDRFAKYFGYALATHVVMIVVLAVMPSGWIGREGDAERDVMFISLAGNDGQETTGLREIAARPVQQATPEPVRPQYQAPAEKAPEMAIPERVTKTPPKPAPANVETAERPSRRTPIRGAEVREGQARIDTGAITGGDGLSLGSSGTGGETDLSNFCCPGYIQSMSAAIRRNWKQQQGVAGVNTVRFTIERDGSVTGVQLIEASGIYALDRESQSTMLNVRLPGLPAEFTEQRLTIRLIFEYKR